MRTSPPPRHCKTTSPQSIHSTPHCVRHRGPASSLFPARITPIPRFAPGLSPLANPVVSRAAALTLAWGTPSALHQLQLRLSRPRLATFSYLDCLKGSIEGNHGNRLSSVIHRCRPHLTSNQDETKKASRAVATHESNVSPVGHMCSCRTNFPTSSF